jgi:hypothetical protein
LNKKCSEYFFAFGNGRAEKCCVYNDGYKYNGKEITTDEATWLTYYYIWNHKRASSIDEARRYYDDTSRGMEYSDI